MQRKQRPLKRLWVVGGSLFIWAACGTPTDERARLSSALSEPSPPPSIIEVHGANAAPRTLIVTPTGPIAMTPPAPRSSEVAPSQRRAARMVTPPPPSVSEKPAPAEVRKVALPFEPARLIGLGRSELADLMGTPRILRNEPPGEVWLYKSDVCVAHIYLYQQAGPDDYKVSYLETRGVGVFVSSAQCLAHFTSGSASTVSLRESPN